MNHLRHSGRNHHNPLQDELQQVFERFFGDGETDSSSVVTSQWVPRVDIKEEPGRFVIFADLPGVDPASIEVNMVNGSPAREVAGCAAPVRMTRRAAIIPRSPHPLQSNSGSRLCMWMPTLGPSVRPSAQVNPYTPMYRPRISGGTFSAM